MFLTQQLPSEDIYTTLNLYECGNVEMSCSTELNIVSVIHNNSVTDNKTCFQFLKKNSKLHSTKDFFSDFLNKGPFCPSKICCAGI